MLSRITKLPLFGLVAFVLVTGCLFGTALAGVENVVSDVVSFSLTDASAYTYGTSYYPPYETATLEFKVAFDVAQAGYLQGAIIRLDFDTDNITLAEARPVAGWGGTTPNVSPTATGIICTLDPAPGVSTVPISTTATTIVEFDFHVNCQEIPEVTDVAIGYGPMETYVDDGVDLLDVLDSTRINSGSVGVWEPSFGAWFLNGTSEADFEGALGTEIEVPVMLNSYFKVASYGASILYDVNKLAFVGVTDWDETLVTHAYDGTTPGVVTLTAGTDEAQVPRKSFSPYASVASLVFRVINNWQGASTNVTYATTPVVGVALGDGVCNTPVSLSYIAAGTITIPQYTASFTGEWLDGGKLSDHDDIASLKILLTNNFPVNDGLQAVITNLNLGDKLRETGGYTNYSLYYNGVQGFGAPGEEREVSLQTAGGTDHLSVSNTPQDLVAFDITKTYDFTPPTAYDDRFYSVAFQSSYDNQPAQFTQVTDTTDQVTVDSVSGTLSWTAPDPIEYLMGEFYCNYASSGAGMLDQDYYTRNAFALHDFQIKISVSGDHHIYDITPELGVYVVSFDQNSFKWAILATNDLWTDQAVTDVRTKFATFTYTYYGGSNLVAAKVSGGLPDVGDIEATSTPGNGYYVTKLSTVSFENPDLGNYYMTDPDNNEQYYVGVGNTVRSRWWVSTDPNPDPITPRLLDGLHGMPVAYQLFQNYPNPFNPTTEIVYGLPEACKVELAIYNIAGQKVTTLVDGWQEAGYYRKVMDGADLSSGIYFYHLTTGTYSESRKMVLLK